MSAAACDEAESDGAGRFSGKCTATFNSIFNGLSIQVCTQAQTHLLTKVCPFSIKQHSLMCVLSMPSTGFCARSAPAAQEYVVSETVSAESHHAVREPLLKLNIPSPSPMTSLHCCPNALRLFSTSKPCLSQSQWHAADPDPSTQFCISI